MRHVSRTHRVALGWLFDRINLDSKIQIKYIDTKNQLVDILTKGNSTRDEWDHLMCLCNISHFSSTVCSAAMAKRFQQDSGEERVTAKSKPMMTLIARTPSVVWLIQQADGAFKKEWYESVTFQDAIDGKLRVQDRASERLQDQVVEEIKELESTMRKPCS